MGLLIGRCLRGGETLALSGDLGTGKTTLVRRIAAGLGAPPRVVSSPTFVLVHEYEGRLRLAHADLYRIEHAAELEHLGLDDYLDDGTVLAVEWAERARGALPTDRLEIRLAHVDRHRRDIRLHATGPLARALLSAIRAGWPAARTQRTSRRQTTLASPARPGGQVRRRSSAR